MTFDASIFRNDDQMIKVLLSSEYNDDFRIVITVSANNVIGIEYAVDGNGAEIDSADLYDILATLV